MNSDLIRIALVSPLTALRAGWRAFLSVDSAIEIVAESTSLNDLELPECPIDILVITSDNVDISQINQFFHKTTPAAILLLVTDEVKAIRLFAGLFENMVFGLLPVNLAAEDMVTAVHALYQGLATGTPYLMKQFLGQPDAAKNNHPKQGIEPLTQRETLVLQLLAQGLSNKQIALNLSISEHTVKFHIQSIYSKMKVNNRAELVRVGVTSGLITL